MDLPFAGSLITQGGAVGLLGLTVILVLTGRLIPVSMYRRLENDRDHWRAVAEKATDHVRELLPLAHVTTESVRALRNVTEEDK